MRSNAAHLPADEVVYVGIDLHRKRRHVTVRAAEVGLSSAGIPGTWGALEHPLGPYRGRRIEAAYSAPASSSVRSAHLKSVIMTTSLVWEPRARAICLPSRDQAKEKVWSVLKSVNCRGGPPSRGRAQTFWLRWST